MVWRRKAKRGQSIVEYLIVAAAIIVAVIGIGTLVGNRVTTMGTNADAGMGKANTQVSKIIDAQRQ